MQWMTWRPERFIPAFLSRWAIHFRVNLLHIGISNSLHQQMCAFGIDGKFSFWVIETQQPFTPRHIAFSAENRAIVDAFYQAGMDAGGRDNGAPGLRPLYHEHYYAAFLLDPDENNVEAMCHTPTDQGVLASGD